MLDFVCFMSARNILTNVRESLEGEVAPTLAAFDVIRGFDVDAGTADWLRSLEEFYTRSGQVKGLEPIYSLEPERDPAPKIFVAAFLYICISRGTIDVAFLAFWLGPVQQTVTWPNSCSSTSTFWANSERKSL